MRRGSWHNNTCGESRETRVSRYVYYSDGNIIRGAASYITNHSLIDSVWVRCRNISSICGDIGLYNGCIDVHI